MKPYYQDSAVTIYHGDCREVLPQIGKVDHVITDPPYEAEAHNITRRTMAFLEGRSVYEDIPFDKMTDELRGWLCQLGCGWLLIFCQAEAVRVYQLLLGDKYRRPMIWVKPDGSPQFTGDRPAMGYESIVAAWCSGGKSRWNGGGRRGVFECLVRDGANREHPTQKPLPLMKELVALFTDPGDLVLDPFMGSGTTLRAAKDLGRKAIGIEIEERYCEIAAKRMAQECLPL